MSVNPISSNSKINQIQLNSNSVKNTNDSKNVTKSDTIQDTDVLLDMNIDLEAEDDKQADKQKGTMCYGFTSWLAGKLTGIPGVGDLIIPFLRGQFDDGVDRKYMGTTISRDMYRQGKLK